MDKSMQLLIEAAPPLYRVKYTVMARNRPGGGWTTGWVTVNHLPFVAIRSMNNWLEYTTNRWIPAIACELIDPLPPPPPPPSGRRLWYILPDDLLSERYAPVRDSVPMTCQFRPRKTIPFTARLQNFIFNLNRSDNEVRDRMAFQGYRDTWNTVGKIRDHYNAITNEGYPDDLPTLELNIGMAGNAVSGIPIISDGSMTIPRGTPILKMETLDPNNLPASISYTGNEHLIHHQTIIKSNVINGQRQRNPFPQMGGRATAPYLPCLTALISPVPLYIEMYKLKEVSAIPNPYNPAWQ